MITKSAQDKRNCTLNLIFTYNARTAWGHIISSLSVENKQRILLPSYIGYTEREGSGVFDPIEENLAEYQFYKVGEKLEIDLDHFEHILKTKHMNIALVIHYFGFCRNDMDRIKELCKQHNVILVEDCAHAFQLGLKNHRLGNYGDFSFYSLHKYLATSSGGVLKVNTYNAVVDQLSDSEKATADVLEQYINTDLEKVSKVRRDNYHTYELYLPKHVDVEVMYELTNDDIPQSFPVRIKNGKREPLYFYLMEKNIPTTALYYRLISTIDSKQFPVSYNISAEILNLPVHQDISPEDVELICSEISNFLNMEHLSNGN